jgi:hypothetical protein|tara:strand:- start:537 stop:779 length:243 start_codon:yes stop_codon:yes gene_type:complete
MPNEIILEHEMVIVVEVTAQVLGENRDARFDEPGECQFSGDIKVVWNNEDITTKLDEDDIEKIRNHIDGEIQYRSVTEME